MYIAVTIEAEMFENSPWTSSSVGWKYPLIPLHTLLNIFVHISTATCMYDGTVMFAMSDDVKRPSDTNEISTEKVRKLHPAVRPEITRRDGPWKCRDYMQCTGG